MNKYIQKIANDTRPECKVLGHRVHVTMNANDERWPSWGRCVLGIGGGFIHFENEKDFNDWRACQNKTNEVDETPVVVEQDVGGRCVPECGPIGFRSVIAA